VTDGGDQVVRTATSASRCKVHSLSLKPYLRGDSLNMCSNPSLHLRSEGRFAPWMRFRLEQIPTPLAISMVESFDPVAHGLHVLTYNVGDLGATHALAGED
jgi:hypothetical protein